LFIPSEDFAFFVGRLNRFVFFPAGHEESPPKNDFEMFNIKFNLRQSFESIAERFKKSTKI